MIIDCISDLHGHYPTLEGGDLLIVAGDCTKRDTDEDWVAFEHWIIVQPYKKIILTGGNHDNFLASMPEHNTWKYWDRVGSNLHYLCDSGTEFEYIQEVRDEIEINGVNPTIKIRKKLKIWGSPWTAAFPGMNPHCKAFTCDTEAELDSKFSMIPKDVDILVTHSPPFTILDKTKDGRQVGSISLLSNYICLGGYRPKLWVYGHVHEGYGQVGPDEWSGTKYVNASHVNEHYQPVNKPIRIEL